MAAIVSPSFVSPHPVDMCIVRKFFSLTVGNFEVTDHQGNPMFRLKKHILHIHDHRVLLDAHGNPLVTLVKKIRTMHNRWEVFRGESTEDIDLLFTVKMTSMVQFKVKLDVFLAENTNETFCDYKVKGSFYKRSCTVYAGENISNIVAQMHKQTTAVSLLLDKTKFNITVYPNVDHAFITALIVILDEITHG